MKKIWIVLTTLLLAPQINAAVRPVAAIGAGLDFMTVHQAQNIMLTAPFQNTYWINSSDNEVFGNVYFGLEAELSSRFSGQLGVSYYQTIAFIPQGTIYQFTDPAMGNLYYLNKIKSRRALLEAKLQTKFGERVHPYLLIGFGRAWNNSYDYHEVPVTSTSVPMGYTFAPRSYSSNAYEIGFGADVDMTQHTRIGIGYQYANIGTAGLGLIPGQASASTIKYTNLTLNEYIVQVMYLW